MPLETINLAAKSKVKKKQYKVTVTPEVAEEDDDEEETKEIG